MHYVLEEVDSGCGGRGGEGGGSWLATTTQTYSIKGEIVQCRVGRGGQKRERSHVSAFENQIGVIAALTLLV